MVVSENLMYAIETQTNTNIKCLVLGIMLIYSIFVYLIKDKIDIQKNNLNYWLKLISSTIPLIYIVMSPLLFLFLLNINVSMELFILFIMIFYLLALALGIGLSLYKGGTFALGLFGYQDKGEYKDIKAERKSLRKYG